MILGNDEGRCARRFAAPALTRHARQRMKDRSIPQSIIDGLVDFGERRPAGDGSEVYYFSKRAWRHFAAYLGTEARHFEKYRSAYAVIAEDDYVITTGWRH
jgi:transposase-like protein